MYAFAGSVNGLGGVKCENRGIARDSFVFGVLGAVFVVGCWWLDVYLCVFSGLAMGWCLVFSSCGTIGIAGPN